jgi:hypothetical protein
MVALSKQLIPDQVLDANSWDHCESVIAVAIREHFKPMSLDCELEVTPASRELDEMHSRCCRQEDAMDLKHNPLEVARTLTELSPRTM